MTLRSVRIGFTATALAIAAIALTGPAARAFTIETLNGNANGNSRFSDPDDQAKPITPGTHLFGPNGPGMQFGSGSSPFTRPYSTSPSSPPPQMPYSNGVNQ